MFVWRCDAMLAELQRQQPELHDLVTRIAAAWDTPEGEAITAAVWATLPKLPIDTAIMEGAAAEGRVGVVAGDFGWNDVGDWDTLATILTAEHETNVVLGGPADRHLAIDTHGTLVAATTGRLIATLGVRDLVIIDTADAVLICSRACPGGEAGGRCAEGAGAHDASVRGKGKRARGRVESVFPHAPCPFTLAPRLAQLRDEFDRREGGRAILPGEGEVLAGFGVDDGRLQADGGADAPGDRVEGDGADVDALPGGLAGELMDCREVLPAHEVGLDEQYDLLVDQFGEPALGLGELVSRINGDDLAFRLRSQLAVDVAQQDARATAAMGMANRRPNTPPIEVPTSSIEITRSGCRWMIRPIRVGITRMSSS